MRTESRKNITYLILIILIGAILCLSGGAFYIYKVVQDFGQVFAQNIYVENIPIGGLSITEAKTLIVDELNARNKEIELRLTHDEKHTTLSLDVFKPSYELDELLAAAFALSHPETFIDRYHVAKYGLEEDKHYEVVPIYDESVIATSLMNFTTPFYIEPVDATIERTNRQFIVTPEQTGEALDTHATAAKIKALLDTRPVSDYQVEAAIKTLPATVTAEWLQTVQTPVASFYTSYNNSDSNRNQNLELAAYKINSVLQPGDIFSLGTHLEPINYDAGYRASKVIIAGKLEEGIGGGVCQIASTLYNAVLLSQLDIVARANHSVWFT